MVKKTVPVLLFALFHTLVDNKIENNIDICFLNLNGTFLCVTQKRKVPIEGWVKVDGIPPSYKAMAGQVGEAGKNRSSKRFFLLPQVQLSTFIGNRALLYRT